MIPIIQREVDIQKGNVLNSHRIWTEKGTQLPNEVSNHIYDFPEYHIQNKGNIIFLSKECLFIECSCHQFHVSIFFNQKQHKSFKLSNSYISAWDSGTQMLTGVRKIWLLWIDQIIRYKNFSGLVYLRILHKIWVAWVSKYYILTIKLNFQFT